MSAEPCNILTLTASAGKNDSDWEWIWRKPWKKLMSLKKNIKTIRKAKRLIDLAKKLEGVARHASTHACGVVISAKPLTDSVPLQHPPGQDDWQLSPNMKCMVLKTWDF